jgi:nucleoid DNA-binding protein
VLSLRARRRHRSRDPAFRVARSAAAACALSSRLMNRNDFIDQIAARTQRSRTEAEDAINAALAVIADALAKGEKVDLRGFGSFQVSDKNERQGRNPKTGESLTIPAKRVAVFKPSKELADRVNATSAAGDKATELSAVESTPTAQPSEGSAKVHGDKINT